MDILIGCKQKDSTDVYENKRYAIALSETDELIGMGLEDTVNKAEVAYFMCKRYQRRGYVKQPVNAITDRIFNVSEISYLILTIDCANLPSCKLAEKCGFELFEKRMPIGHVQPNMESDSYYYYRLYRKKHNLQYLHHLESPRRSVIDWMQDCGYYARNRRAGIGCICEEKQWRTTNHGADLTSSSLKIYVTS